MSAMRFRTVTFVEGPEIDEWLASQEALDDRDLVRWWTAYRLLGGGKNFAELTGRRAAHRAAAARAIPLEDLA